MDADVVVVGAGLAGLRCATELLRAGHEVIVLEAAEEVGGRIRTDRVDGFQVDRGFQLLNPAYPAVRRWVDTGALRLGTFEAGVAALTDERLLRLCHPLRAPGLLAATVRGVAGSARDLPGVARWLRPLVHRPGTRHLEAVTRRPDLSLADSLDLAGVDGTLRRVLERFFAGVLLDDTGSSSAAFARLLAATFAAGDPGLPAAGMQALPHQLAALLGVRVRLGVAARRLDARCSEFVFATDDGHLRSRHVVVATGPVEAATLASLPAVPMHGVVTHWYATQDEPTTHRVLHVDARPRPTGPLVNTAVITHAAPTYAPPGWHLIEASALLGPDRPRPSEPAMRRHAAELLGPGAAGFADWQSIARHEVPHALPAQSVPLAVAQPVVLDNGVVVCGDHRDTASIQGALVSGHRAARNVAARLGSQVVGR
ncbi:NAD(P)/FAD-dependent oxidoreductase [soil metagenome]